MHFTQQWFAYGDQATEEALHDMLVLRAFAGLDAPAEAIPDESTILNFRHLLERHNSAVQILAPTTRCWLIGGCYFAKAPWCRCHADYHPALDEESGQET